MHVTPQSNAEIVSAMTRMHVLKHTVKANGQYIGEVIPLTLICFPHPFDPLLWSSSPFTSDQTKQLQIKHPVLIEQVLVKGTLFCAISGRKCYGLGVHIFMYKIILDIE